MPDSCLLPPSVLPFGTKHQTKEGFPLTNWSYHTQVVDKRETSLTTPGKREGIPIVTFWMRCPACRIGRNQYAVSGSFAIFSPAHTFLSSKRLGKTRESFPEAPYRRLWG